MAFIDIQFYSTDYKLNNYGPTTERIYKDA